MESPDELGRARDEVFRRVGRNVLMYQSMELMLKTLLNKGRFKGTISELKQLVTQRATRPDRRMLGQLINPLINHHLTPVDLTAITFAEKNEISISFSFTVEHTAEEREIFRIELEALVAERNELIHHSLSRFQLDSVSGCVSASAELEQQRHRILPMSNKLQGFIDAMVEASSDMLKRLPEILHKQKTAGLDC
jgi:hypothetical protein